MIYMNNMAVCNYIVGVLGAVIGGLIMQAAAAFPLEFTENGPGPGFWPFTLGMVLGAVSVLLLLYTFINKTDLHGVKVQLSSTGNKRVYLMMGFVVLFCVLISILGFYPAAALMIPAVMRLMDYRNYKVIVGFNSALIAGGIAGVLQPTTSALLHNTSTLFISMNSMKNITLAEEHK